MGVKNSLDQDDIFLREEAAYFYKKIFKKPILPTISEEYVRANNYLLNQEERTSLKKLTLKRTDIESIEIAWRYRHKTNLLTEKIHILIYVSEADPQNYDIFINEKNKKLSSFFYITTHFIRSVYKLLKGQFLLKRYKLV